MVHDVLSIKESLFQKAERHKNAFALVFAIFVILLTILFTSSIFSAGSNT